MSGFSTQFLPSSFKQEVLQGIHNFSYMAGVSGTSANASNHITGLPSNLTQNLAVGMSVSDGAVHIPAGSYVSYIDSSTSLYMSTNTGAVSNATGTNTGLTFGGDDFRVALGIATPTGTYNASTTNWGSSSGSPTVSNMGTDELAGSGGYTQGGYDLTAAQNITPTLSSGVAITTPGINPSWTSATFSTSGMLMYNNSKNTRAVYVTGFGGTQTVAAGTFTILLPTNTNTTALIRIA